MTPRRRTKVEHAPDEQELEMLVHGDLDELEALGWDVAVKRLIAAGFREPPGEGPHGYIDWLVMAKNPASAPGWDGREAS